MPVISDAEKQNAKETLEQVGELAKEFAPLVKPIAEEYMSALLDTKAVTQAQLLKAATDLTCALVKRGFSDEDSTSRALNMARALAQGVKE